VPAGNSEGIKIDLEEKKKGGKKGYDLNYDLNCDLEAWGLMMCLRLH
jgi:hypothetical protein